jgi:hypothetical protein
MARRWRVHIPSAFVHVSHRCNHGESLFEDPKVKNLFLEIMEEAANHRSTFDVRRSDCPPASLSSNNASTRMASQI